MKLRYRSAYLILGFTFILAGCKKPDELSLRIKNDQVVTIKSTHGYYVSADWFQNSQVVANRKATADWEKFSIKLLGNNKAALRAYNFNYLSYVPDKNGLLVARNSDIDDKAIFTLIEVDSGKFVFQNDLHKYIGIGANDILMANQEFIDNAERFFINVLPGKSYSYFSFDQLIPLIAGLVLIFISVITFQYRENEKFSVILLLLGGLSVRIFTALLNPYLNLWDEEFHALVAKNMMDNPFVPVLYKNPLFSYSDLNWTTGHIWLHKQPLFLWQMALSMKIFGVNIFALRLPSVLMSTAVIFFIYRIGKLSVNKTAGFFGALLFALANFSLEIAGGYITSDHNDVAFLFYVSASIWSWVEYENASVNRKKYFLILTGVLSGCAILVKWLAGLLVFAGWGLSILLSKERRIRRTNYIHLAISFIITLIIFMPWQIYIHHAFPVLSQHEFALNTKHFFNVVEGHGGDFWWHFNEAEEIYGISKFFLIFSVIVFTMSLKNTVYKIAFLTYIISIYIFFGLAATKMTAFPYCIAFLIYLSMGTLIEKFFKTIILNPTYLSKKIYHVIYVTLILFIVSIINLNIEKIQYEHTLWKKGENSFQAIELRATPVIKSLSHKIANIKDYIIMNCRSDDIIPVMFFNDVIAAYDFFPDPATLIQLKQKGFKIAVFDNGKLPDYLLADKDVVKITSY
jgi:4-amino-4-deoxy-L-arabinose transferase-like glycosyltransferase